MKLYDKIRNLLFDYPEYRNSDKKLIWRIWMEQEGVFNLNGGEIITYTAFMKAQSPETVRRTRQKVQQDHPELQASESVRRTRKSIQDQKGTFVYREPFTGKLFN